MVSGSASGAHTEGQLEQKLMFSSRMNSSDCLGHGAAFAGSAVAGTALGSPVWRRPRCLPCPDLLLKMKFLITREPMTESCCALSRRQIKPVELAGMVLERLARFLLVLEALGGSAGFQMLSTAATFAI